MHVFTELGQVKQLQHATEVLHLGFTSCLHGEKREGHMKVVKSNQQMVRWFLVTTIPKQHGDACSYPAVILTPSLTLIKKVREAHLGMAKW